MTGQDPQNSSNGGSREGPADPRRIIEGYEIVAKIGQGGMGAVYKARQLSMDRMVAMKILLPSLARNVDFIHRFLREARAAGRFQHPNIVSGIDAGESNGYYYFAMEFVEGRTVADILETSGRLSESEALKIASHMTAALDQAHQRGLVHRDIKPENIMVTPRGTAKLMDLGLAKSMSDDIKVTSTGMAVGTPHYVSPEQASGEEDLDIRSDIYSLGATLYHMVTGDVPFDGASAAVIMTKHLTDDLEPPHRRSPEVSERVSRVIQKMMAKEPEARYETPAELAKDIGRVMEGKMPLGKMVGVRKVAAKKGRLVDTDVADKISVKQELLRRSKAAEHVRKGPWKPGPATIAGLSAGVVVVVLGILLLTGGRERPTRSAGPPVTPSVDVAREERLEEMLNRASRWEAAHPEEFEKAVAMYEEVSREGIGTVWEMRAREAVRAVRAKQKRRAEKIFDTLAGRAERLAESGDYDAALDIFRKLPPRFEKALRSSADEAMDALRIDATTEIEKGLESVETLLREDRYDRGVAELERISKIKYEPLAAKIAAARARWLKGKRDIEEMARREAEEAARRKIGEYLAGFDEEAMAGDYAGARAVLKEAGQDEILKKAGSAVRAADTLNALEDLLRGFGETAGGKGSLQNALNRLVGRKVTLNTIGGPKTGTVRRVSGDVIELDERLGAGAATTLRIRFSNLTEAQKNSLVPPPKPKTAGGWLALAVSSIAKEDVETAKAALLKVPENVLLPHYREKVEKLGAARAEAAAREFWEWRLEALAASELNKTTGEIARQRLYEFRKSHGRTEFARSIADKLSSLDRKIAAVLPYAFSAGGTPVAKPKESAGAVSYTATWQKMDPTWIRRPSASLHNALKGDVGGFYDLKRNLCIIYCRRMSLLHSPDAAWAYDAAENTLTCFLPGAPTIAGAPPKSVKTRGAAFDASSGCYFVPEGNMLWTFNPNTKMWRRSLESRNYFSYIGCLPDSRRLLDIEFAFRRVRLVDPAAKKVIELKESPLRFRHGAGHGGLASPDADGKFLFFGGSVGSGGKMMGDTWLFDPGRDDWTWVRCAESPPARTGAKLTYDRKLGVWVLFGGQGPTGPLGDVWVYNGAAKTWVEAECNETFSYRGAGLCYEEVRGFHLLFRPRGRPPETWICRITAEK